MIVVRYAVCSESAHKPLTRAVCDARADAERILERIQREDAQDVESTYWIAELGPECEAWRWLAGDKKKATEAS